MEVGSSSLPGTTHRTLSAMCAGNKPASNTSHVGAMWAGSVDVAFNIVDDSIKLYHKFETLYWGISSAG